MKIGIVGGGIGGLTAGIALRAQGHEVTVLEEAAGFSHIGTGITLSPNAMLILKQLGVAEEIAGRGAPLASFRTLSGTGKVLGQVSLKQISEKFGVQPTGIHRAALHGILAKALGEERISCGWTLKSARQTSDAVTLTNTTGDSETFDLVIGADGIHSSLRDIILGESPLRDSGQYCWRGTIERPENESDPAAGSVASELWGPGRRFGVVPIDDRTLYWYAVTDSALKPDNNDLKKDIEAGWKAWPDWMKRIISQSDDKKIVSGPLWDKPPTDMWYRERIVFIGDAIHPTTPNMGQGAGMAIESAFTLAHCLLKHKSHTAAFRDYFVLRRKRTSEVTKRSRTLGQIAQTRSVPAGFIRNALVRLLPDRLQESALESFFLKSPLNQLGQSTEAR